MKAGIYGMSSEWGISIDATGMVYGFNVVDGSNQGELPYAEMVGAVQIAPGGGHFVIGTAAAAAMPNGVDIWLAGEGEPTLLESPRPHTNAITDVDISVQGDVIATSSLDGTVALYFVDPVLQPPPPSEFIGLPGYNNDPIYAEIGNSFTIPVKGTIIDAMNVDVAFNFNGSVISPDETEAPWDSILVSSVFDADTDVMTLVNVIGDTIYVTIASSTPHTVVDGTICELAFLAGQLQADTWLNLDPTSTNVEERSVDLRNGQVFVQPPPPLFGDVTSDGSITALDASLILQHVVRLIPTIDTLVADVTDNGSVTGYDAAMVLLKIAQPEFQFPALVNWGGGQGKIAATDPVLLEWARAGDAFVLSAVNLDGPIGADLVLRLADGARVSSASPFRDQSGR